MQPRRVLKRPSSSTSTAIKGKPPQKSPVVEEHAALDHDHHHRRPPRKEEKEDKVIDPRMTDKSDGLALESSVLLTDAEENGKANEGVKEHWEMAGKEEEEERGKGKIDGEDMTEAIIKGEEELKDDMCEEDVGDEHGEELEGFEEEHRDVVTERRKRKEFEVFVGGLDRDVTEDDLRNVFSQVGEITEVRLLKNPVTKKNKGFAFLRFATVEQAKRAVNELKHPVVNGKQCGVAPSKDNDTLFVGNICKDWTKETLKEKLANYGVEKFEELTLIDDLKNEGRNRGFAFLGFSSRADAVEACKRLQKRDVEFGTERMARVAFADTFTEPDEEIMAQVRKVFIDCLPSIWEEDSVKEHFKKFGRIEKVELARNMPAAKRTDFGFITFETHDAAVACVDGINSAELGHGDKKVKVRARLTRPRQRGKSARHPQGGYPVGNGDRRDIKASWGSSISSMDNWKITSHSGRSINHNGYDGILNQSLGNRNRHPIVDVVPKTVGRRRQFASSDRSFSKKSPVYGTTIHRDYINEDDEFSGPSDFARAPVRRQSDKDIYSSRGSGSLESSRRNISRRIPLYDDDDDDDGYERYMEQSSSYRDSYSRDYRSISGSKRPYSLIEEAHPRSGESSIRQSGARFDYGGSSFHSSYSANSYGSASTRLRHGSRSGYDGGNRHSTRHSHGQFDTDASSMGYRREKKSRGDAEVLYCTYDRDYVTEDYIPSRSEMDVGSYSPVYISSRTNDGYLRSRRSGSYY
ncbi:Heterogeneous nuclear ribonucleoprotein Q [Camellia lanceoleosa]|uniref:Heterogeneous nuclear ribonucleoprotein Q n=2 Tax=Camellia lanceoleosa TaxID=1840588 RepID=A0ACC0IQ66_9ERIC|nr:Heterogeneous nuclear ribonucleoprotein Q [Camellia lanceoleosa]